MITVNYVISTFKNIYHQPRPIMISDLLQGCAHEYGDPSGHAMSTLV